MLSAKMFTQHAKLKGTRFTFPSRKTTFVTSFCFFCTPKKLGKRKVQRVPQSQTAALSRHQEEEEPDKTKQAQNKQTYEKH